MPEGPQVKRTANLIADFIGSPIENFSLRPGKKDFDWKLPLTMKKVESHGKNIFVTLSDGQILRNHMLMSGKWAPGCAPKLGKKFIHACFTTSKGDLGYYGGGLLKLIDAKEATSVRSKLGPDILKTKSMEEAFERLKVSSKPIGVALLDQELVAGIGNIYKSEGLFAAKLNPLTPAKELNEEKLNELYEFLFKQMTKDVTQPGIVTTTPELLKAGYRRYVYKRYHSPCLICGTKIERFYQAERSTYYCPHCQNLAAPQ